jgi:hypothetical protein
MYVSVDRESGQPQTEEHHDRSCLRANTLEALQPMPHFLGWKAAKELQVELTPLSFDLAQHGSNARRLQIGQAGWSDGFDD